MNHPSLFYRHQNFDGNLRIKLLPLLLPFHHLHHLLYFPKLHLIEMPVDVINFNIQGVVPPYKNSKKAVG